MGTVSIDEITTGDVAPAAAPYRISNKATKDTAVVLFTPHDDALLPSPTLTPSLGLEPDPAIYPDATLYPSAGALEPRGSGRILCYRLLLGGVDRNTGVEVGRKGVICGSYHQAGQVTCSDWSSPSFQQLEEDITYPETGQPADGAETANLYVLFESGGWA